MNPASFNSFMNLLEEVSNSIFANGEIRDIIADTTTDSLLNLEKVLTDGL